MKADPVDAGVPEIFLVGAGVVGRAVAAAHLDAGLPLWLVDLDRATLSRAADTLARGINGATGSANPHTMAVPGIESGPMEPSPLGGYQIRLTPEGSLAVTSGCAISDGTLPPLMIESIVERRDAKRALLAAAEEALGPEALLATNTSTLAVGDLSAALRRPGRCCGLHFFMPVDRRPLVEVVQSERTAPAVVEQALRHVRRLGKTPLVTRDAPGFVVNRMLVPQLNQAILMLGAGASADRIERAAVGMGMPMSPLELVDLIGTRTAFDCGRAFWQAFPRRLDPAPILPAMVKAGLSGVAGGKGFYDYAQGKRSAGLSEQATGIVRTYQRDERSWSDAEVAERLRLPMLIEAACLLRDRVVSTAEAVETAMRGGLGWTAPTGFFAPLATASAAQLADSIQRLAATARGVDAPGEWLEALRSAASLDEALEQFIAGR